MALREILAEFEIKVDDKALKSLEGGLEGALGKLKSVAAAFTGGLLVNEVGEFINQQIEVGSRINDTAEKLGVGTEELQQFAYAAKLSGVEFEGAAQSLGFLNKNIGGALGGNKELVKTFADLKVPLKDANGNVRELGDVLPDIADSFGSLKSQQEKTTTAMAIFGRSGAALLPILSQGSDGLEELYKEFDLLGGSLTEDFIAGADAAGDEIDKLKFSMEGLKSRIALAVFPILTQLTKYITGITGALVQLSKETNVVQIGLVGLAGASGLGALRIMASLSKALGFVAKDAEGVGGAIKAIFNLGLRGGLIVAGLATIALLAEDIYTLITGGKSAIGQWLDQFGGIGTAKKLVDDVTGAVHAMSQAFVEAGLTSEAFKSDAWAAFKWTFDFIIGGVVQLIEWFGALAKGLGYVIDVASSVHFGKGAEEGKGAQEFAEKRLRRQVQSQPAFTGKETIGGIEPGANLPATVPLPPGSRPASGGGTSGGGGSSAVVNNNVNVNVTGVSNPREMGAAASQGVQEALSAQNQKALAALSALGGS